MRNFQIATYLNEIGDLLEATKETFRARAYRRAANVISNLKTEITQLKANQTDLKTLAYVGEGIERIIHKIISDKNFNPQDIILTNKAFKNKILKPPFRLHNAMVLSQLAIYIFQQIDAVQEVLPTGGLRRRQELINELELLVIAKQHFFEAMNQCQFITNIEEASTDTFIVTLFKCLSIKLILTNEKEKSLKLFLTTGSNDHLKELKKIANIRKFPAKSTEREIYQSCNMDYIEPELRENQGELQASIQHSLPKLVTLNDLKGDLHAHTNETDGVLDLEKLVEYAMMRGYEYFSITDHTQRLKITRGLDKKRLFAQIKKIDALNAKLKNFTILKSSECDILEDGTLDFPNDVLKELDLVVCSVHSKFRISKEKQTERILRAIENPYCTILGHPTGRLINNRLPYEVDIEKILLHAKQYHCVLELNSQPYRLDLKDSYCRLAKQMGIKIALSSDAHSLRGLNFISLGLTQARRAGLEPADIINTYPLTSLKKLLRKV